MPKNHRSDASELPDDSASPKALLPRRALIRAGLVSAGIAGAVPALAQQAAGSIGTNAPEWMKTPGRPFTPYGMPSKWQDKVQRTIGAPPGRPGTGSSRTPLQQLEGTITPNGLH